MCHLLQLARRRTEQLVHVLPESIQQRTMHLRILSDQLTVARSQRCTSTQPTAMTGYLWFCIQGFGNSSAGSHCTLPLVLKHVVVPSSMSGGSLIPLKIKTTRFKFKFEVEF